MKTFVYSTLVGDYDECPKDRQVISDYPQEIAHLSDRRKSRFYKINSHLLSTHDMSVYLDACLVYKRPFPLITADIAVFRHPNRNCLYKEATLCKKEGLGNIKQIHQQIKQYFNNGFPLEYGLSENCCIIRKNNSRVKKFNEIWWEEYIKGSERDQISFMYAVWKSGVRLEYLAGNPRANKYYGNWGKHRQPRTSQEVSE